MIVPGPLKLFRHAPLIGDGAINRCCATYVSVTDPKNNKKKKKKKEKRKKRKEEEKKEKKKNMLGPGFEP